VLRGWAGPDLLDTYEAEWRPVGARRTARSADPGPEASGAEALARTSTAASPTPGCPTARAGPRPWTSSARA
jgi:hypothetical protein